MMEAELIHKQLWGMINVVVDEEGKDAKTVGGEEGKEGCSEDV